MEKLKMHSPNLVAQNIEQLAALFPSCVTESRGKDGKLKQAIDFDLLKQELSTHIVEGPQERYELNWPGKRKALLTANAPIAKTLRPCQEESVDFDTTKNLFIEGDNLDALKLLQETYLGKVKMIYIDPPYNTGNDFIYEDDFAESSEEFLRRSNQVDEKGNRLVTNKDSNGRFHSDWLSMIYPRIKLAKNLLSDDGVLFLTLDDTEVANMRRIGDEIFGDGNFVANVVWQKKYAVANDDPGIGVMHDHVLVYRKSQAFVRGLLPRKAEQNERYKNPDNDPRGEWASDNYVSNKSKDERPTLWYSITHPRTGEAVWPEEHAVWRYSKEKHLEIEREGRLFWGPNQSYKKPRLKRFLNEVKQGIVPPTWWTFAECGHNDEAQKETAALLGQKVFSTPKPIRLIERMITIAGAKDGIILDFFAGSGSTAHATLKANAQDGGCRQYIAIQLPEPLLEDNNTQKSAAIFCKKIGVKTNIAELTKERLRRAGKEILENCPNENWNKDVGFRVLKIDSSNMSDVYYNPDAITQADLFAQVENVKEDRTEEDLLFQVMLDWGVDLALPIRRETIAGKTVFFVDADANNCQGALVACFDKTGAVNEAFIKTLAAFSPLRLVFRDAGFASDAAKINVEQLLKQLSPTTDVKTI
ncbi:site-specific DNA-methyltransferase [Shewanella oncorhynchi]|uniref:site-specific DNA-methyltransferase n=1 Tax=Shewanella TaxID=22 RepID=UPI0021D8A8B3|nr:MULTISPECIES: site-specific DNA-methyltransferase [unclassified Shewanella]MCU8036897.1 site-specific DNA-methyltransferase [Shewanella sp. SM69]MCU8103800.1 site-specific DNA-methyltransferase [Shewanella sp. SM101]